MKLILLITLAICLTQAYVQDHTADKLFLIKQKAIYELFWHIDQPTVYHPDLYQIARSFSIEDNIDSYTDRAGVIEFLQRLKHGVLPRGQVFSIMQPGIHDEVVCLYRLLYSAKDYETFYKTAVWARFHVNEQMYVYVLSVVVMHRPDTKYIHLPPLQEVLPHFFFNNDVLHHVYHIGVETGVKKTVGGVDYYTILTNYSGSYFVRDNVPEQELTYFTEDVGLNSYYFLVNHDFPYWMNSVQYNLPKYIRGEIYLYGHKQLLARYYLERLSNDIGEIEYVDLHQPIVTGYYPMMHYQNGLPFPQRPVHSQIPLHLHQHIQHVYDLHTRISNAIDVGYIVGGDGKHIDIYTPEGLNYLGNIIQGNADSLNPVYYGHLDNLIKQILGFGLESVGRYNVPSALEIFCTNMRDPIFYNIYKNIVSYFWQYKAHLPSYTYNELVFPGVKVESVTVDKLMTFFDNYESMLNNAVSVRSHKEAQSVLIKARQYRLNHKPFTYHITINSDKVTKGMVRVFLGPKHDVHGHELDINENYMNFVELDHWVVDLKVGTNKVERSSHQSIYVVPDEVPSEVFYKKILKALDTEEPFTYSTHLYGFPDRLILPKGKKEGMPFKLFVFVSEFDETKSVTVESPVWGNSVMDNHAMGYPLDRPVHSFNFTVPNMIFKDVLIYHRQMEELNITV